MGIILAALLALGTDWALVVKPLEKQVVRVEMKQGADSGTCSGSVIDAKRGYVLTAAHCVPEGDKGEFSMTVNRRDATVARVNRILDLAILKFTVKGEEAIELAEDTPAVGSDVAIAGYSFGSKQLAVGFGHVSQKRVDEGNGIWLDCTIIFGQSGGPSIDPKGHLVGVNSAIYSNGPAHLAQVVPVEDVRDFVKGFTGEMP